MRTENIHTSPGAKSRPALKDLHRDCFACGICNPLGLQLHFHVGEDGIAAAVWMPTPDFSSYPDRVHGGIIATLLDSAMVHAIFAGGIAGVTADCRIRYRQKVKLYEPVHVTGWVETERLGVYRCRAEVHQADTLVVWAAAKFMAIRNQEQETTEGKLS